MADIVKVLPDAVANQIAAGEVIQRPASVIKELVENAVDAGADNIKVVVKDAGKTLIQVIDNGCGLSENDARLCFERHATSKIRSADDLFAIRTMGFRGEALASIASIAQVELKSKRTEDDNGTHIRIEGSDLLFQQPTACSNGTSIAVKNLFFNVPARRRFLKSTSTELKHIITEFQRIALAHPELQFSLFHNDNEIYHLDHSGQRERITKVMGKHLDTNMVNIKTDTSIISINGFIGKPEKARKTYGEQFFFVNGRYMKHPYFHRAVVQSYAAILLPETIPSYFLFLETDPAHVDVNIHPTKTEIKFDEERAIFQIIHAAVREGLGKFNIVPSLDFNQEGAVDIPVYKPSSDFTPPAVEIDHTYNPFDSQAPDKKKTDYPSDKKSIAGWEQLYPEPMYREEGQPSEPQKTGLIQFKHRYLMAPVKSGLMIIHINRALERIHYEQLLEGQSLQDNPGQKLLYPEPFDLNPVDLALIKDLQEELAHLGFVIELFGGNSILIQSVPGQFAEDNLQNLLDQILEDYKNNTFNLKADMAEKLARSISKAAAFSRSKELTEVERQALFDRLFACQDPQTTPSGKAVLTILQTEDIEKRFL